QEVRIVLLSAVKVNEFTAEVALLANRFIGGTMELTQSLRIEAGGGAIRADHEGIFGYGPGNVKRAGFGTDGKLVAGGGVFEADEQGIRVTRKSDQVLTFWVDEDGNAYFDGDLSGRLITSLASIVGYGDGSDADFNSTGNVT